MNKFTNTIILLLCLIGSAQHHFVMANDDNTIPDTVITNVTIIDPATEKVLSARNVFIKADRISAITAYDKNAQSPHAVNTVEGAGKYLMPGLIDAHVHIAAPNFSETTLPLFLVNGVVGVREMSGDCWEPRGDFFACADDYRVMQKQLATGELFGPHIMALSSAIVRGPMERDLPHVPEEAPQFVTPSNKIQARKLVDFLAGRDIDFIKIYNLLERDVYTEIAILARQRNIPVAGHVPLSMSAVEVGKLGHRSVEHARRLAYDCSDVGKELRDIAHQIQLGEREDGYPKKQARLQQVMDTFNVQHCKKQLKQLAALNVAYSPTHVTRQMDAKAHDKKYREDPRRDYMLRMLNKDWDNDLKNTAGVSDELRTVYQRFFEHGLKITRLAHEAGMLVLAGSDANDTMSVPGFSLHDELELLVQAGLSKMDVLKTATINPARFLGKDAFYGSVQSSKKASLLLLDANPLEDIRHTTKINTVFMDGRYFDRQKLDTKLAEVKQLANINPLDAIPVVVLDKQQLTRFEGTYVVQSSRLKVNVGVGGGVLLLKADGMPLVKAYPSSETLFFMKEDDTTFEFITGDNQQVTAMKLTWSSGKSEVAPKQEK